MTVEGAEPKRKLAKDLENELGEYYYMDLRQHWDLKNDEEKHDIIPEIYLGKNVADFIDPDIMKVNFKWYFLDDMLVRKPGLILNKSAGTSLFVRVFFLRWHEYRVRRMSTRWTREKRVSHFDTLDSQYSILSVDSMWKALSLK